MLSAMRDPGAGSACRVRRRVEPAQAQAAADARYTLAVERRAGRLPPGPGAARREPDSVSDTVSSQNVRESDSRTTIARQPPATPSHLATPTRNGVANGAAATGDAPGILRLRAACAAGPRERAARAGAAHTYLYL